MKPRPSSLKLFLGSEIILLLKIMHDRCKQLLAIRRWWASTSKKFACPVMWDPIIRYWFNALGAGVITNSVLAELSVDQGGELGSGL
jgi:hypothetical protein